ncbi:ABC transporter ATP-binding protein [Mangrovitalea sediminis]|uniref:ABC transporter ATP-binding protein n=1 Tax=Mangrovitalea sediminis TaxID=1982043 RepID=UPI000BE56F65|nr:ABC transporter ATP-binding protein [Mangrovitalea sediminis]
MTMLQLDSLVCGRGASRLGAPLSLQAQGGEFWMILGENGVGKSTLLLTLAGLLPPLSGRVFLDGIDVARFPRKLLAQRLGMLLQQSDMTFPFTVREAVSAGRYAHRKPWHPSAPEDGAAVDHALRACALTELAGQSVQRLSGGEQRRVAIATLLAQEAGALLLDEPVNPLDLRHQSDLMAHFRHLVCSERRLVMMSVHDLNLAARFADRVILMFPDGSVEAGAASELLTRSRLEALYRHPLHEIRDQDTRFWVAGERDLAD